MTKKKARSTKKVGPVAKVGNLTRDFQLYTSEGGTTYAQSGLAVDVPEEPGKWSGPRRTLYYDLAAFRGLAENAAACLRKGTRVVVVGEGEVETWADAEGTEHTSRRILATAIGPDVRWARVEVEKIKGTSSEVPEDDDEVPEVP